MDSYGVMGTLTWTIGEKARHRDREEWHDEALGAIRRLEVTAATGKLQPLPAPDEDDDVDLASIPKTRDEAWNLLIWSGAIMAVAAAVAMLHKVGLRLPFLKAEPAKEEDR